jgi:hypothetical protein
MAKKIAAIWVGTLVFSIVSLVGFAYVASFKWPDSLYPLLAVAGVIFTVWAFAELDSPR